jgi:hypothetical protein
MLPLGKLTALASLLDTIKKVLNTFSSTRVRMLIGPNRVPTKRLPSSRTGPRRSTSSRHTARRSHTHITGSTGKLTLILTHVHPVPRPTSRLDLRQVRSARNSLTTLTRHPRRLAVRFPQFLFRLGYRTSPLFFLASPLSIVFESGRGWDQPHRRFTTMFD